MTSADAPSSANPRPPGCAIQLAAAGDVVSVSIPPAGFRGPPRILLVAGVIWSGFVSLFLLMVVGGLLGLLKVDHPPGIHLAWSLLALLPFIAVGAGLILAAVNIARRRTVLVFSSDAIVFTQLGIFGQKEKQWPRSTLADIQVGDSSVEINNRKVPQLQLHFTNRKPFGFLTGRAEEELNWLAEALLGALGQTRVPGQASGLPAYAADDPPPNCPIQISRGGDVTTISIPALGFRGPALFMLIFGLIWTVTAGVIAVLFFGLIQVKIKGGPFPPALSFLPLVFGLAGILTLILGFHLARRRTALVITADSLVCTHTGLLGPRQRQWPRNNLARVCVANSVIKINGRPVPQLQIHFHQGRRLGLLTGCPPEQLHWLVHQLRKAIGPAG